MTNSATSSTSSQHQQQHDVAPSPTTHLSSFLAGIAGGSASTILLYPLDLIKVRMQVDESRHKSVPIGGTTTAASSANNTVTAAVGTTADKPRTICTTVRGVIRHEGYIGLYRGLAPAIIGSAASWGGFFILYEEMKRQMLVRKQAVHDASSSYYLSVSNDNSKVGVQYDLTKDMHVDEEMDINTNATNMNSSSNSVQDNRNNASTTQQQQAVKLGPVEHFSASCLAGACMVALTNPIWLIKTRLQLQNSQLQQQMSQLQTTTTKAAKLASQQQAVKPAYRGLFHAATTIIQEEGVLALYKGSIPALMLVSHGGIQFVTYEFLKGHFFANFTNKDQLLTKSSGKRNGTIRERLRDSLGYLVMGAASKFVASTTTYPLQVIKARLQQRSQVIEMSETTGEIIVSKREYSGVADCIRKIVKNEGMNGFFKGCVTNAMRVAPSAAITFVTYEFVLDVLTEKG